MSQRQWFYDLTTARLTLREWQTSDMDDLVDGLNDLTVSERLAFVPYPYTQRDGTSWIAFCAECAAKVPRRDYHLAISLNAESKVIGGISLEGIDLQHRTAGGGIWLNAAYHNRGYGTEAFATRNRSAFAVLNLRGIENGYFEGNQASRRMLEKLNFQVEGLKRQRFICMADGKPKDEVIVGLLRKDWEKSTHGRREE